MALANAVVTGSYALAISLISLKLYAEFSWSIFRLLEGDIAMQKRYFAFKVWKRILLQLVPFIISIKTNMTLRS